MARLKLAIVASHPIQYQAPLHRALARRPIDLEVLFCSDFGTKPSFDPGFGQTFQYDVPLTDGYPSEVLRNFAPRPHIGTTGLINPELARRVVSGRYDAVVMNGYNVLTNVLAMLAPRSRRSRLLLRGDSNAVAPTTPTRRVAKQVALRAAFARIDHFLVSGTLNRRYYERYGVGEDRMTLAPYSVDNEFFSARADEARAHRTRHRAELGVTDERPLVIYAAKLLPKKRPLDLLEAFALARPRHPMRLVFVGDGEQRAELERAIQRHRLGDDVAILGFRNQSELPNIYAASDAMVLPSDNEPWGLVVNEVMAAGLAVAVSDRVGCGPDLVRDNGAIFPVGNVQALANVLSDWAADPLRLARQKQRSREIVQEWSIERTADGFVLGAERALAAEPRAFHAVSR